MPDLSMLRKAGVVEVLLYLLSFPKGLRKNDIRLGLQLNPKTAISVQTALEKAHLLKTIRYRDATAYKLNEFGKTLAQQLLVLNNLLDKIDKKIESEGNWFEVDFQQDHEYPRPKRFPSNPMVIKKMKPIQKPILTIMRVKISKTASGIQNRIIPVHIVPKKQSRTKK